MDPSAFQPVPKSMAIRAPPGSDRFNLAGGNALHGSTTDPLGGLHCPRHCHCSPQRAAPRLHDDRVTARLLLAHPPFAHKQFATCVPTSIATCAWPIPHHSNAPDVVLNHPQRKLPAGLSEEPLRVASASRASSLTDGFAGGINTRKYMSLTKTSRATAYRELADLVEKGCLRSTGKGGRSSGYEIA